MSGHGSLYVIFAVLIFNGHGARAIDCYSCTSSDDGCGEDIDTDVLVRSGKVESGCSSCVKTFSSLETIWSSVTRSCAYIHEETCDNILGYGRCSCTTTFCNGVKTTSASTNILFPVVVVLLKFTLL